MVEKRNDEFKPFFVYTETESGVRRIAEDIARGDGRDRVNDDDWNRALKIYRAKLEKGIHPESLNSQRMSHEDKAGEIPIEHHVLSNEQEFDDAFDNLMTMEEQARRKFAPPEMKPRERNVTKRLRQSAIAANDADDAIMRRKLKPHRPVR